MLTDSDTSTSRDTSTAPYACTACRRQKRKCSKELPKCSLCSRLNKLCEYNDVTVDSSNEQIVLLQDRIAELEARLSQSGDTSTRSTTPATEPDTILPSLSDSRLRASRFPAVVFLDPVVFSDAKLSIPKSNMLVSSDMLRSMGGYEGVMNIATKFFATIHTWLPFVSKKRLEMLLTSPNMQLKAEYGALLLAMKLTTDRPIGLKDEPQTRLYHLVKDYFSVLESHGNISIQLIQVSILIGIYEIGHGIYPAAYLTPAKAARLGQAFGIDQQTITPLMLGRRFGAWAEGEEARRTWWAVMLLDRFVNLSFEGHALATNDPLRHQTLPADDASWDAGEMSTTEPLFITTPTNVQAGPFARTCQATNLLGRYIRHRDDTTAEAVLRFTEALQLHKTVSAFAKLLPGEVMSQPLQCSTAMALSSSLLLHLYEPYSCIGHGRGDNTAEEMEMQTISISSMQSITADVLQFMDILRSCMASDMDAISPLVIESVYLSAATYAWLVHEQGSLRYVDAYNRMKEDLRNLNSRWRVAGEYLEILDETKCLLYENNPLL